MNSENEKDHPKDNSEENWEQDLLDNITRERQDFFSKIARRLSGENLEKWNKSSKSFKSEYTVIIEQSSHLVCDDAGKQMFGSASFILAIYRTLKGVTENQEYSLSLLGEALLENMPEITSYIEDRFGISQDAPEEAFERISEEFKKRGEIRYGQSYKFVQAVQDNTRSFVNVEKCFLYDFFRTNGSPEVLPLCCALDDLWKIEFQKPKYGIRFEQPTTFAKDGDMCCFHFIKT